MRLWHKDLIPVLPRLQLIAQWREVCAIAGSIERKGTPNHILVNKVLGYPPLHFKMYAEAILQEMKNQGYKVSEKSYTTLYERLAKCGDHFDITTYQYVPETVDDIYRDWHNDRYLQQCYCNLQEKYDCGGISKDEWARVEDRYLLLTQLKTL